MPIRHARNEAKQPFQDITDQFTALPDSLPTALPSLGISVQKPRRRARAPGGTLGAKLRATRNPRIPSSLPPSSPPSASSRLPWGEHEHKHDENVHPLHILTSDTVAPNLDFDLRDAPQDRAFIAEVLEDWVQDEPTLDPANMSDPFGFFAVERQLKAERAANPAAGATVRARYRHAPSPVINTMGSDLLACDSPLNPPMPHKRVDKRRAIASPSQSNDSFSNPNTSSMPSTPSPSKPASSVVKGKMVPVKDDSSSPEDAEPARARTRGSRRISKKPRSSGSLTITAKNLHSPPEKHPTRRTAPARRPTEKQSILDRRDGLESKKKKGTTSTARKNPTSSGKRGKGKAKEDTDDQDAERQEKWERERQARLEYFRKLQDYQVEKENVYVV